MELVKCIAGSNHDIKVHDMHQANIAARTKQHGVRSLPSVVVYGQLAGCCAGRGLDGGDSVIELTSAGVLIWRLRIELRHGQSFAEAVEHAASRIDGALLFGLAKDVVFAAGSSLWTRPGANFSWPGLIVGVAAIPVMWFLSRRKLRIADPLGSGALRTDANR